MKTLTKILGIGAVLLPLAVSGCKRQLIEPVKSEYRQGYAIVDNRGQSWYPHRDTNGIICEIVPENGNTPKFVSDEEVRAGRAREPDGVFVLYITPEIRETIEAQQKLSAELGYQMAKSKYDTLKQKRDETMAKEGYKPIK
jgi:hypothetical protein